MKKNIILCILIVTITSLSLLSKIDAVAEAPFCQTSDQRVTGVQDKNSKDNRALQSVPLQTTVQNDANQKSRQLAWDQVTDGRISRLEQSASSDNQKQAISQFKDSFHKAVEKKRIAAQALATTFNQQILALSTSHRTARTAALTARGQALIRAAQMVASECKAHKFSDLIIRDHYNKALREAQNIFRSTSTGEQNSYSSAYTALISKRQLDEQAIQNNYISEIKQALESLNKHLLK